MTEVEQRSTDWKFPAGVQAWNFGDDAEGLQKAVKDCPEEMSIVVQVPPDGEHSGDIVEIWPSKKWVRQGPSGTAQFAQITPEPGNPPTDPPAGAAEGGAGNEIAVGSHRLVPKQIAAVLSST
jgi:hypothetical protein